VITPVERRRRNLLTVEENAERLTDKMRRDLLEDLRTVTVELEGDLR
jgi:hypothetical protein